MDRLLHLTKVKQPMKKRRKFTSEFKSKVVLLGNASSVFESASSRHDEAFKQKLKKTLYISRSDSSK